MATGPLISSLVIDEVVTPVGRCQDNLLAQLTRLLEDDATERAKSTPRQWVLSKGSKSNRGENALFQLMTGESDMPPLMGSYEDLWMAVLSEPPAPRFEDLVRRPRSFITAPTKSCLEKLLPDAHLGEALVSIGLTRAADATKFGDLCPPLMDGLFPGGPVGELVRGRSLVTDHGRVLREVAAAPDDRNCWLSRLVWLVEGSASPEALGRWIIERMANARTLMMDAGELAQRRSQIERVFRKLEQGPTEARKIYHNLSGLNAPECFECLRWLELTGISRLSGDRWALVEGARLSFNDCTTPLLEV